MSAARCPRCGGNLYLDEDVDGARRVRCLLCWFEAELPSERVVRYRREWEELPEEARRARRGRPLGRRAGG